MLFSVAGLKNLVSLERIKATGIYLLVPLVTFSVSIFSTPIFAKHLTAEEFGFFGYYNSITSVLSIFFGFSASSYYMSMFFRETEESRKAILTTLTLLLIIWNLIFFPVIYSCFWLYFRASNSVTPFFPYLLIAIGGSSIGVFKLFLQSDFRLREKPIPFFLTVAGYRVLTVVISLWFVADEQMGLYGRMIGIFVVELIFFLLSLGYLLCNQNLSIKVPIVRDALKFILPLLPSTLLYVPLLNLDNFILESMNEPSEMGLYNIGRSISYYVYVGLFPFFQTVESKIYKYSIQGETALLKRIVFTLAALIGSCVALFCFSSSIIIDFLTAGRFVEAVKYANITAITSGLMVLYSINDAILNALQKTKLALVINALTLTFYLIVAFYFSHHYRQMGVAIATVLAFVFLVLTQLACISSMLRNRPLKIQE